MAVNPQDSVGEAITKELLSNQIRHYTRAGCTTELIREMLVIEHEPLGQYDPDYVSCLKPRVEDERDEITNR